MERGKKAAGLIVFCRKDVEDNDKEISFLLLQASNGSHHWTPPKGHLESGELFMDAAIRETEEEAGLLKKHLNIYPNFLAHLEYPVREKQKTVIYWLAELKDSQTKIKISKEHQDYKWFSLEDACEKSQGYMIQALKNSVTFINSLVN